MDNRDGAISSGCYYAERIVAERGDVPGLYVHIALGGIGDDAIAVEACGTYAFREDLYVPGRRESIDSDAVDAAGDDGSARHRDAAVRPERGRGDQLGTAAAIVRRRLVGDDPDRIIVR